MPIRNFIHLLESLTSGCICADLTSIDILEVLTVITTPLENLTLLESLTILGILTFPMCFR